MKELICIVCPRGCKLQIDPYSEITGANCSRGEIFATEEINCPKRTVCSTVATIFKDYPVLPVRTSEEIAKEKIPELMRLINSYKLTKRVNRSEVLISNLFGTSCKLISTSSMLYTYHNSADERRIE